MRKAVNIDDLPADAPRDAFGFPSSPQAPPEPAPGATLADMINDYQPVRGNFWSKAPKLKQQRRIVEAGAGLQGKADPSLIMDAVVKIAEQILFVRDGDGFRRATSDEIEEEFDLQEIQEITGRLSGLKSLAGDAKN